MWYVYETWRAGRRHTHTHTHTHINIHTHISRQSLSLALKVGHINEEGGGWVHGTVTPHSLSLRGATEPV